MKNSTKSNINLTCLIQNIIFFIKFISFIGQKFALLEIKTLLVYILKNFKLEAVTRPESFKFSAGLLIRTKTNIKIKIMKR